MSLHPTAKEIVIRMNDNLGKEISELRQWKQKSLLAQKYEDVAAIDDILKKTIDLQLSLTNLLHD